MKSLLFKLSIVFLFFSVLLVEYVFVCTDAEYNLNQQIARGYISRDACFFDIVDLSRPIARWGWIETDPETGEIKVVGNIQLDESEGYYNIDMSPIAPEDPSFELVNSRLPSGMTAVESVLSSGEGPYFTALHNGTLRGVYYRGSQSVTVPMQKGRFFYQDECLNDKCLAVVGSAVSNSTYEENGETWFDYLGRKYQVIGVCGLSGPSALDSIVFVNIGSLSPEEQLNGMYYIDNARDSRSVFDAMNSKSIEVLNTNLKIRRTPTALIDTVSGGMYLKSYLKASLAVLLCFFCGSAALQIIRRQTMKTAVMRLCGISFLRIAKTNSLEWLIWGGFGVLVAIISIVVSIATSLFTLPMSFLIRTSLRLTIADLLLLALMLCIISVAEYNISPRTVVNKI